MSNKVQSLDLDNPNQPIQQQDGPVECLGKTFENDQARREYYLAILAVKLKDPEFRKIEGFPIGEDEDILNLSDPPYYTACPNPFIEEFIAFYGRPYDPNEKYKREPYATDVSEGKSDILYQAHAYHTKVPPKAIMRYILHYTKPGDIVLDGFSGTGMTGVACQLCNDKNAIESLGYTVNKTGDIFYNEEPNNSLKNESSSFSKLGNRKAIINDLSPIASFIASNYTIPFDIKQFEFKSESLLKSVENTIGWMFETFHSDGINKGRINYTVWSEIFSCKECGEEISFIKEAFDFETKKVRDFFPCPKCGANSTKANLELVYETKFDDLLNDTTLRPKRVPALINYNFSGKTYEKKPDDFDFSILEKIEQTPFTLLPPILKLPEMQMGKVGRMQPTNTDYIHKFFNRRSLHSLSLMWKLALEENDKRMRNFLLFFVEQAIWTSSVLNRFRPSGYSQVNQFMAGVFYVPSQISEPSPWYILDGKSKRLKKAFLSYKQSYTTITNTGDCGNLPIRDSSIDYIFTDPPFGENIYYSDLNLLIESWHRITTNSEVEAIIDKVKKKTLSNYQKLMEYCFKEYYRVLKPGRWLTVEFSNTKSAVWNGIQSALTNAGFIIGNVSILDKQQNTFQAVNSTTAVKQDLVISAYKPNGGFEDRFIKESDDDGVWDFIRTHLGYLPIIKRDGNELVKVPERDPRILFDQVVAYFVRNMRDVPLSSREFQDGLQERFSERDGMVFLPEQVAQYDKARMTSTQLRQLNIFVDDEASAIEWLRQLLNDKPQTYQDIHPKFINELSGWKKAEMQLELMKLLEQNFLKFNGQGFVPAQIHSYLSTNFKELRGLEKDDPQLLKKAKDRWFVPDPNNEEQLQALRERDLLKQFEEYKSFVGRKIKLVRLEAVRAGFKKAWQEREYGTIIQVAEKIPEGLLQEDQKLLMWYDQAQTRYSDSNLF